MFDKKTSEKDINDYFDETADLYFVIIKNIKSHFFCIKRNGLFYSDYGLLSEFTKRYEMKLIKADSLEELKQIYKIKDEDIEVYVNNKTITQVATELNISQPALSKLIKATLKEYKIKWPVFFRKKKNKVTYNTNNMLK